VGLAKEIIASHYPQMADLLKDGHPWKEAKALHGALTAQTGQEILSEMGFENNDPNRELICLIGEIHDLGRVPDGLQQKLAQNANPERMEEAERFAALFAGCKDHGEMSVKILEEWGVFNVFSPDTADIIRFAIAHHTDDQSPILPRPDTDEAEMMKFIVTALIRDLDKLALFIGKTAKYLYDEKEIQRQEEIVKNLLNQKYHLTYRGRDKRVEEVVMNFVRNWQPIPQRFITTYQQYMIYMASWALDMNSPEVLRRLAKDMIDAEFTESKPPINMILDWLDNHICKEQATEIRQAIRAYFAKNNITI